MFLEICGGEFCDLEMMRDVEYYECLRILRTPVDIPKWSSFLQPKPTRPILPEVLKIFRH